MDNIGSIDFSVYAEVSAVAERRVKGPQRVAIITVPGRAMSRSCNIDCLDLVIDAAASDNQSSSLTRDLAVSIIISRHLPAHLHAAACKSWLN